MVDFNRLEKRGIQKGIRRGILNQIRHGLEIKFPDESSSLFLEIERISSVHALRIIEARIYHCKNADELRSVYKNFL